MQNRLTVRRILTAACAAAVIILAQGFAGPVHAAKGAKSAANKALQAEIKAAPKYKGMVKSIDVKGNTITIQDKKAAPMKFTVSSTTKVKVDEKKATFADVKVGMHATIRSADKTSALQISAKDKDFKPTAAPAASPSPTPKS